MKPESIKLGQIIKVGPAIIGVLNDRYSKVTKLIAYTYFLSTHILTLGTLFHYPFPAILYDISLSMLICILNLSWEQILLLMM